MVALQNPFLSSYKRICKQFEDTGNFDLYDAPPAETIQAKVVNLVLESYLNPDRTVKINPIYRPYRQCSQSLRQPQHSTNLKINNYQVHISIQLDLAQSKHGDKFDEHQNDARPRQLLHNTHRKDAGSHR
jgi:hypothetical protein